MNENANPHFVTVTHETLTVPARTATTAVTTAPVTTAPVTTAPVTTAPVTAPAVAAAPPIGKPKVATKPKRPAIDFLRLIVEQRAGGEVRPQQETMVNAVEQAITNREHLIVQAGTGTGKSLGYLIPAITTNGSRVVISTATKQLGEQLVQTDLPTLAALLPKIGGKTFTYALIKGRNNYVCVNKIQEMNVLESQEPDQGITDALFDIETQRKSAKAPTKSDITALNKLLKWADETETGDRSEAPVVSDLVWDEVSTNSAGCPGRSTCNFGNECFTEKAREKAREANVVVANHALVAQDLRAPSPMLGDYDILITDETHELESYLSSAWGHEVTPNGMKRNIALAARKLPRGDTATDASNRAVKVIDDLDALTDMLMEIEPGLLPVLPENINGLLIEINSKLAFIATTFDIAAERSTGTPASAEHKSAAGKIREVHDAVAAVLTSGEGSVRWLEAGRDKRTASLKVAPLWIGPTLMTHLGSKTLIATSATITVGGSFDPMIATLALNEKIRVDGEEELREPRAYNAVDVGTPFDYAKQAMLYIPDSKFPAPIGADRQAHTDAVLDEVTLLVKAAGGRTLALFTTTAGAKRAAEHLRRNVKTPILAQGEAPPGQLLKQFEDIETSTLCATMGFWHGVNIPGPSLSVVTIDKLPFAPMNDPLASARRDAVDKAGGNGFTEVYVNGATIMLAQGVGRLIRNATDKGVVAILDTRLTSKSYSQMMLRSLPPMRVFRDREVVIGALERIAAGRKGAPATRTVTVAGTPAVVTGKPVSLPPQRKAAPSRATTRGLARTVKGPQAK